MIVKSTIKKSVLAPTTLIAGGAGFIGSHLSEFLLKKGARVVVVDNFSTGKNIHVKHLLNNDKFALFDADINVGIPNEIESVDYIFHLAGLEEYLYSKDIMDLTSLLTNGIGTKNLLDLAKKSEAKFLLASTLDVYLGMMSQTSLDDYYGKYPQIEKKYSMAEAKRYAEALVWEYHKRNGTDVRVVRLPEIYGPRMDLSSSGNLGRFLNELMSGKKLTIFGEGVEKEYYVHINDAVSGMFKALLNENTAGKIFTLVPDKPVSVLETAFLVKSVADGIIEIDYKDETNTKLKEIKPDMQNNVFLDWAPNVEFKDGIVGTLNWFGYKVNERAFKTSKLIEENNFSVSEKLPKEELFTLSDVKEKHSPNNNDSYDGPKIAEAPLPVKDYVSYKKEKKINKLFNKFINLQIFQMSLFWKISVFVVVLLSFLSIFIFVPILRVYSNAKTSMEALASVPEDIVKFNTETAKKNSELAYEGFAKTKRYYASLGWVHNLLGEKDFYTFNSYMLSSVTYFSNVFYNLSSAAAPFKEIWESLKPNSEIAFDPELLNLTRLQISNARNNLNLAYADYNQVRGKNVNKGPLAVVTLALEPLYGKSLDAISDLLELFSVVTSDLPNLLGFDSPKKYLIIFQNNNEIRPTGGFIGSYAFLYLNKGKIEELVIDDIYNPDGQIDVRNIRVAPPDPVADFLAEDRLYIRNANWDPDFTRSSQEIKNLFYKLNGEDIAGVFAIDLEFVKNMLDVTGPIYLAAYNESVDSSNLYERTQYHASYNYEEGSQQKRQFLTVLGSKLLESFFGLHESKMPQVFSTFHQALSERHVTLHLFSSPVDAFFAKNNWSGALVQTQGDYLNVVNANLGGTKANYYVENKMEYNITSKTRDGLLRAELILDYKHTGIDESWPGGPYKNYLRVLNQNGSKLTGAKIIYNSGTEEDIFEKIIISRVEPYQSFETSFTLNPTEEVRVIFYYDLPVELAITKNNKDYAFYWKKQAGTHNDSFSFSFVPPFGVIPKSEDTRLTLEEDGVYANGKLDKDFKVLLKLE